MIGCCSIVVRRLWYMVGLITVELLLLSIRCVTRVVVVLSYMILEDGNV